ncbi:PhoB family transcriptional regulator [Paenibacillus sp. FSL R7-0273]|uniref:response regulator transcription factor n=1 Tax=Paenibacillus sp. FSL R7-0273 TaxID=1536772 RepID=UPI0004F62C77|nr:response regulator transcription factor [Paenibacillus sp. FSL R7-0273]AIQ46582.1 PhoB family transcriptional regulator [Paenibacillus sp. FSL R7-0273]OMF97650.1 DNA-binding response regulator [Paenibacillus sp. FSL R7-0273]
MRILVIEDEEGLSDFIILELKHEGYEARPVYDGREGLEAALGEEWDIILLDLMLPKLNGMEICRRVKAVKDTPIIMITARDSVMDRVTGLDSGADDYIPKPFAIEELLARIRVIVRRNEKLSTQPSMTLGFKDLELHIDSRMLKKGDRWIELTKKEYELLFILLKNVNRVLTREMLVEQVWDYDVGIETNVVDVYIRHLRNKLETADKEEYIQTIRGIGYIMRDEK